MFIAGCTTDDVSAGVSLPEGRMIAAYWQNWHNPPTPHIPLTELSGDVNRVYVAFALPEGASGAMTFVPHEQTQEAFKADMNALQSRGVEVLISVGGGNHVIALQDERMEEKFVESMTDLIAAYGFDGVDIDLEGASVWLDEGDLDFRNPTTPRIRHFISAMQKLKTHFGESFLLTAAPETQYVVGGFSAYGGAFGGYLPILDALREDLDVVQMQLYNSGSQRVYTGNKHPAGDLIVEQGTPDFAVALNEMLILGFPVAGDENAHFDGLGAAKVAIGLPATPSAASGGYMKPSDIRAALRHLMTGRADPNTKYVLREEAGHPELKGGMTWSANWDHIGEGGVRPSAFTRFFRKQFHYILSD